MKTAQRFENLPPYTPIEPFEVVSTRLGLPVEDIIKLDANENPYGPSPLVRQALAQLDFPHIYPDPESRILRDALSQFTGVPKENLLVGSGVDELIDLLLRVLLEKDDLVINCPPTFGMYSFDTQLNSGITIEVPRLQDFSLDVETIQSVVATRKVRVLFITAPNNPDGRFPSQEEIRSLLDLPVMVVIDEAYIEFCDHGGFLGENITHIKDVLNRENLVVFRTFSKWAGLAGLRVGYGAFPIWLMPTLWKAKQPYNVNVAADAAALASLKDLHHLSEIVSQLKAERSRLFTLLTEIPYLHPYPSQANFILCRVFQPFSAFELKSALMAKGILVRYYNTPYLKDCIRISVGKPYQTDAIIEALQKFIPA
jgi:histidinol-phosphate aminotransferase